jgi:AcrR family transcriptional regulator
LAAHKANKKQDIVQAATLLFAEQGFAGTTTLQISKAAGITEPVIYYHFKGKDELFTGIIASTFETFFAHLNDLPEKTGTEFEKSKISLPCILISSKRCPTRSTWRSVPVRPVLRTRTASAARASRKYAAV